MYRILVTSLSLIIFSNVAVHAQNADQIVSHLIQALGGKEKLQSINSLYQEGTCVMANGSEVKMRIWRVFDRLYRQEIDYGVGNVVVIVTPRQGWISSPRTGGVFKALEAEQLKALQTEIDPAGVFIDYNQKGNKIEKIGVDTLDGRPCFKLRVWFPNHESILYWVDRQSWYLRKEERHGGGIVGGGGSSGGWNGNVDGMVQIGLDDWRAIPGGYVLPYAVTIGGLGKVTITKVQVNGTVNVDALSKPR
ncbi:MAG TPA: hypothetical protein VG605_18940 [Puia sp.]|jgi:hypothetical protein|nr:hypothetical protein [Puia sp.]